MAEDGTKTPEPVGLRALTDEELNAGREGIVKAIIKLMKACIDVYVDWRGFFMGLPMKGGVSERKLLALAKTKPIDFNLVSVVLAIYKINKNGGSEFEDAEGTYGYDFDDKAARVELAKLIKQTKKLEMIAEIVIDDDKTVGNKLLEWTKQFGPESPFWDYSRNPEHYDSPSKKAKTTRSDSEAERTQVYPHTANPEGGDGAEGAKGAEGDDGAEGGDGAEGAKGAKGDDGAEGAKGDDEDDDAEGAKGDDEDDDAEGAEGDDKDDDDPEGAEGADGDGEKSDDSGETSDEDNDELLAEVAAQFPLRATVIYKPNEGAEIMCTVIDVTPNEDDAFWQIQPIKTPDVIEIRGAKRAKECLTRFIRKKSKATERSGFSKAAGKKPAGKKPRTEGASATKAAKTTVEKKARGAPPSRKKSMKPRSRKAANDRVYVKCYKPDVMRDKFEKGQKVYVQVTKGFSTKGKDVFWSEAKIMGIDVSESGKPIWRVACDTGENITITYNMMKESMCMITEPEFQATSNRRRLPTTATSSKK